MNVHQFNRWIKIDTVVFLALLPVAFLICLFCKTWATETCLICYIWSLYIFVVHWNEYAKFSSFLPHIMSGKAWLQFSVYYHYYLYITVGILITRIESLNIKIMLIQEYFDSALLLLTGLVASAFSWGSRFICWSLYIRPQRSNTVLELMSSGLQSCAFIVNRYITKASTCSWCHNR
jgi:hypothetical protein